ncbi:hypothetical protein V6N13_089800 [Hibiscus sabdariffa]
MPKAREIPSLSFLFTPLCRHGLIFFRHHKVIEGDSLTIIKKLQASSSDLSELSAIIFEVQAKAKTLRNCSFNFTPRASNQVAHIIAKDFSLNSGDRFWVEEIPSSALRAVAFDCRNLRPP